MPIAYHLPIEAAKQLCSLADKCSFGICLLSFGEPSAGSLGLQGPGLRDEHDGLGFRVSPVSVRASKPSSRIGLLIRWGERPHL